MPRTAARPLAGIVGVIIGLELLTRAADVNIAVLADRVVAD